MSGPDQTVKKQEINFERRACLRLGALSFLGVVASGGITSNAFAESLLKSATVKPTLGVQLYTFRQQMKDDVRATLAKVKGMGFTDVEAAGYQWSSAAEFRQMLDEAKLNCVSFFTDYNKIGKDLDSVVKDAKTLGAKYVIIGWIPHQKTFTLAECNQAIADFNAWGARLSAQGLRLAYHIHGYEFQPEGKGTLFDKLMAETKPENLAIEMDVFWVVHPGQDPVALLKKYGRRIELLHLKDMQKGLKGDLTGHADVETNVTIGTGQIDFPAIVKAAKQVGVKYFFIEDESSRVMEQVPRSAAYLKTLM